MELPSPGAILKPMRLRLAALGVLLSLAAACDRDGGSVTSEVRLLRAAREGKAAEVARLLDLGVDIETRNPGDGWTPLFWASVRGHPEVVKLLVSRGARLEARDRRGLTPLLHAARWGKKEGVAALLAEGASLGAVDGNGWNALMWAAFKGQTDMAAFLLDQGAALEARDPDGRTPLMLAAMKGQVRSVELLLARGARAGAPGPDKRTAADLADESGYADLARSLRARR